MTAFHFETLIARLKNKVDEDEEQKKMEEDEFELIKNDMSTGSDTLPVNNYQTGYKINPDETRFLWETMSLLGQSFSNVTILE